MTETTWPTSKEPLRDSCTVSSAGERQFQDEHLPNSLYSAASTASSGIRREIEINISKRTITEPDKVRRNSALDFTKGSLVLIMILYHWINYFMGPDWPYYRYLRFLTPSFILVTGFLVSNVYLQKYRVADWRLSRRLLTRGLKLLALFAVLNVARMVLLPKLSNVSVAAQQLNLRNIAAAFAAGNSSTATGKVVAFYILVPISYLLIVAAGLVFPYRFYRHTFHASCLFLLCWIVVLYLGGFRSYNLEFVTIGLLGTLVGFISIDKINKLLSRPYILVCAYICYLVAITVWNVPFLLLIIGACLSVSGIYLIGLRGDERSRGRRHVDLLGKYSLFGYVIQIAILQLLSAALRHMNLGYTTLGVSFLAAFGLTMASVEVVDRARVRSTAFDGAYRAIFA
jgi:hypothetical protein